MSTAEIDGSAGSKLVLHLLGVRGSNGSSSSLFGSVALTRTAALARVSSSLNKGRLVLIHSSRLCDLASESTRATRPNVEAHACSSCSPSVRPEGRIKHRSRSVTVAEAAEREQSHLTSISFMASLAKSPRLSTLLAAIEDVLFEEHEWFCAQLGQVSTAYFC